MTESSDNVFDLPPFTEATQSGVLPLFPLKSVLFPKGRLPLQIFEQRYLDMIRRAMRAGMGLDATTAARSSCTVPASNHSVRSAWRQA